MKAPYQSQIDKLLASDSRVWIYQSDRPLSASEQNELVPILNNFTSSWKSHGATVKGAAYLFYDQFIVLLADERATGVSGCSTDSSVRMIKQLEQKFGVNLFERTQLAFLVKAAIQVISLPNLQAAINDGTIGPDTIYFNNLVQTKEELENNWMIPASQSWLQSRVSFKNPVS